MKKLFTIAIMLLTLAACSQQTLPSRHPDHLSSRYPKMLPSRAYQQPKVKIKGDKVTITMSKQQYLELERRRNEMIQHRPMRAPFRPRY